MYTREIADFPHVVFVSDSWYNRNKDRETVKSQNWHKVADLTPNTDVSDVRGIVREPDIAVHLGQFVQKPVDPDESRRIHELLNPDTTPKWEPDWHNDPNHTKLP